MAFLQIQTRTAAAAPTPLSALPAFLAAALARLIHRPRTSPEGLLAAQARRAEARAAVDRLIRHAR